MFNHDPLFDEFLEILAENHRQDYLAMEQYYAKLDQVELGKKKSAASCSGY